MAIIGDDALALQLYEKALVLAPDNADLYYLKAKAEVRLSDLPAAITDLRQLDDLDMPQSLRIKAGKLLAKLYARSLQADRVRRTWQAPISGTTWPPLPHPGPFPISVTWAPWRPCSWACCCGAYRSAPGAGCGRGNLIR